MWLEKFYEDPTTLHVVRLDNRAYYIPYTPGTERPEHNSSDRVKLLNGIWDFAYFNSVEDAPECIIDPAYVMPGRIKVPSVWQDHHQYTNIRYSIPYDPPYVPRGNSFSADGTWLGTARESR
ncbi:MAG: hypothetical protein GX236_00050 [Clostridiaceae bacterium]|jgi:beta-galactosidase|nr:hypothetical protein [Clostridiaceae bacterium]